MAGEGRALIYPTSVMMFGARPLVVPKLGNVLCASAGIPFCLSTGQIAKPADWYESVMNYCGMEVTPDSMSPLPCSEVVLLGELSPVLEEKRQAYFRCGALQQAFILYADPVAPNASFIADHRAAVWHEELNPNGRGGGHKQDQHPLIVRAEKQEIPIWLGQTPFDHPERVKLAGTPDGQSAGGWPTNAEPQVLCESHSAFWVESLHPGDPLEYEGLTASPTPVQTELPKYRVSMMYGLRQGEWKMVENARIHTVMVLPAGDIGVMVWRASIPLSENDLLGEDVMALLGAMEDISSPVKDISHWAGIVGQRWLEPDKAIDDRPLLPESIAETMSSPLDQNQDPGTAQDRLDRAEEWIKEEAGVPDNPFGDAVADNQKELMSDMQQMTSEEQPDPNKMTEMAKAALADSKKSHEESGFPEKTGEEPRPPLARGEAIEAEIKKRLQTPYSSEKEVSIVGFLDKQADSDTDGKETVGKMAEARISAPVPILNWPAFNDDEAILFGDAFIDYVGEQDVERHVDISGLIIDAEDRRKVSGRVFDGLLAEEIIVRKIDWSDCEFRNVTFATSKIENCTFQNCTFENVNFSNAYVDDCQFNACQFKEGHSMEPAFRRDSFQDCTFEGLALTEPVMQANRFTGGHWQELQVVEGVLLEMVLEDMRISDTTFNNVHAPHNTFRKIEFFKFWGMGKGLGGCVFEEVKGNKCGFVGGFHFNESRFMRTHFVETGFTIGSFKDVEIAGGCQFNQCDFSGALFENTQLAGVRFLTCSMTGSNWENAHAPGAWFYGATLRGVDFGDTELAKAVFVDADLDGTVFQPGKTVAADFRGTVMAEKE